jgi:hypothetical protein
LQLDLQAHLYDQHAKALQAEAKHLEEYKSLKEGYAHYATATTDQGQDTETELTLTRSKLVRQTQLLGTTEMSGLQR